MQSINRIWETLTEIVHVSIYNLYHLTKKVNHKIEKAQYEFPCFSV
jgi:hypothetical protein